jgi:peptide deformylase
MAVRTIVATPDPVLRRRAKKVTVFDKDVQTLIDDMIETMRQAPGVGLAAPQVGISLRVIVVEYGENDEDENAPKKLYAVINPEIAGASTEMVDGTEACLSIPRIMGDVDRHEKIMVKGFNRFGKPVKYKLSGWFARIFQHEIDHLDGILFTDRATKAWRIKEDEEVVDTV